MKSTGFATALVTATLFSAFPSLGSNASAFKKISPQFLACEVSGQQKIQSLQYFASIEEIAFFGSDGRELPVFWDTFSILRDHHSGTTIIGNFTAGEETEAKSDMVITADGRGRIKIAPAAGAELVNCRFREF